MTIFFIMFIIGLVSSMLGSLVGLGGGLIFVPALLFLSNFFDDFSWVTPQTAVAMSLLIMIFNGLSSTLTYLRGKRVDIKSGLIFLIGSIPGGILGVYFNQFFPSDVFEFYFGITILFLSGMLILKKRAVNQSTIREAEQKRFHIYRTVNINGQQISYSYSIILGVAIAVVVGMLSGLFGIGGGALMVTVMIAFFSFPVHIASATSMFMIFVSSVTTSGAHIFAGNVVWLYALGSVPGAWIGGMLGAMLNQRLESNIVEWVLRIMLMAIGLQLIF